MSGWWVPDRATRAFSFGEIAQDYDRYRPGPPAEAAAWVLGEGRHRVLDLGAGTGGLTRELVRLVERVVAAEPEPRMRSVLASRSAGAAVLGAVGEHLPLATGCLDGVIASSSWHWMDPEVAGAEVARVLRPGGVFGLLWSGPDREVPWVAEILPRRRFTGVGDPGVDRARRRMTLSERLPFTAPETTLVRFFRMADLDELAGLSGTYSVVIAGGGPERGARIAAARERATRVRPDILDRPIELPMVCRCWRAMRTEEPAPLR